MKKVKTLKLNKEFKRAYYSKNFRASPFLVTYCVKNGGKPTRIGITTSKKIGSAVARNRAKRIIRAAFYSIKNENPSAFVGVDLVFVARNATVTVKMQDIRKTMYNQLLSLNLKII